MPNRIVEASLSVLVTCLTGCGCGDYSVATGYFIGDVPVDGHYRETCGPNGGAWGSWNLFGDDMAVVFLEPSGRGDQSMNSIVIDMIVNIPIERMVAGEVLSVEEISGSAMLTDSGGNSYAGAGLVSGQVEIVSDRSDGDDPCTMEGGPTWDGPTFVLRWDLAWHGEYGSETYDYTASGKDRVGFDTFLSESCGGWY